MQSTISPSGMALVTALSTFCGAVRSSGFIGVSFHGLFALYARYILAYGCLQPATHGRMLMRKHDWKWTIAGFSTASRYCAGSPGTGGLRSLMRFL